MITASRPSWTAPFTGLSPRAFRTLVGQLRRQGADLPRPGRPWSLSLEDRVLLVATYWRTNLTLRQLAPLFGVSKSAADRIIDYTAPLLALQQRRRYRKDTVLIVDGTLVPTRDHTIAEQSKNYRYSTNHQVVIDFTTANGVAALSVPQPAGACDYLRVTSAPTTNGAPLGVSVCAWAAPTRDPRTGQAALAEGGYASADPYAGG